MLITGMSKVANSALFAGPVFFHVSISSPANKEQTWFYISRKVSQQMHFAFLLPGVETSTVGLGLLLETSRMQGRCLPPLAH